MPPNSKPQFDHKNSPWPQNEVQHLDKKEIKIIPQEEFDKPQIQGMDRIIEHNQQKDS